LSAAEDLLGALPRLASLEHRRPDGDGAILLGLLLNERPLLQLFPLLKELAGQLEPGEALILGMLDPDWVLARSGRRPWPGEGIDFEGQSWIHRPLRQLFELCARLGLRLQCPRSLPGEPPLILASAIKEECAPSHGAIVAGGCPRASLESVPAESLDDRCERKYGVASPYRRFDRLEEPEILDDWLAALRRLEATASSSPLALSLGCNDGRELDLLADFGYSEDALYGIDAAPSAVAAARERFPGGHFFQEDLARLKELGLPRFGLVLLLNLLQCTTLDRGALLRDLTPLLAERCGVLVSIPNCHLSPWGVLRQPLDPRDPRRDRSLVHKDLRYLTRFFYRAGFRKVESFGSYDALLVAWR